MIFPLTGLAVPLFVVFDLLSRRRFGNVFILLILFDCLCKLLAYLAYDANEAGEFLASAEDALVLPLDHFQVTLQVAVQKGA